MTKKHSIAQNHRFGSKPPLSKPPNNEERRPQNKTSWMVHFKAALFLSVNQGEASCNSSAAPASIFLRQTRAAEPRKIAPPTPQAARCSSRCRTPRRAPRWPSRRSERERCVANFLGPPLCMEEPAHSLPPPHIPPSPS